MCLGILLMQRWRRRSAGILSQNINVVRASLKCWIIVGRNDLDGKFSCRFSKSSNGFES